MVGDADAGPAVRFLLYKQKRRTAERYGVEAVLMVQVR